MFKTAKNQKYVLMPLLAIAIALFAVPTFTSAATKGDYGYGGIGGGSGYYTSTPVSTYSYPSSGYYTSTPVSTYSYKPSYSYTPSYSSYIPSSAAKYVSAPQTAYRQTGYTPGGGYTPSAQYQYVYSSNSNSNSNSNHNTNTNTNTSNSVSSVNLVNNNNPVNTNDINLVILSGGSNNTPQEQALDGNCYISPSTAYINQDVSFNASATGGSGGYTYQWSGSDGIQSSSQSFTGRFSYAGYKSATVVIRSGSQSITRTCNVTVQEQYQNPVQGLYCVASPSNPSVYQTVTWSAYVSGGYNYAYSYSWSGTDGLYGTGQSVSRSYTTHGYKTATVTAYVNGQTLSANCNVNVQPQQIAYQPPTIIRNPGTGTPVAGVFLNEVPNTGIDLGPKMAIFATAMALWSAALAYVIYSKRKSAALATTAGAATSSDMHARIEAFKQANMKKKGIL